jgi:hypothetical protein
MYLGHLGEEIARLKRSREGLERAVRSRASPAAGSQCQRLRKARRRLMVGIPCAPSTRRSLHLVCRRRATGYAIHGSGFPLVRAAHWLTNIDLDWQTPMWRLWFDAFGERYRFHPPPHDFLDGELRAGWLTDPDGNPIQIVRRRH